MRIRKSSLRLLHPDPGPVVDLYLAGCLQTLAEGAHRPAAETHRLAGTVRAGDQNPGGG